MKKVLALLLAILSLLSVCALTASAAADAVTDNSTVMQDLASLRTNGVAFDEKQFPVNTSRNDVEVLGVAEVGYRGKTNSTSFAMYIYLYNPGCIEFENTPNDYVQIGLNMVSDSYSYYGLELASKSNDNRFLKYKVTAYGVNVVKQLWSLQEKNGERVYNISGIKLVKDGKLQKFAVGRSYIFSGYDFDDTLQCSVRDCEVRTVELHVTSWVSPNAGTKVAGNLADEYDHYEIHSVYFAIDKALLNNYGYISSIRANYDSVKLTPIVVTRPGVFDETTKNAILSSQQITAKDDVMDLVANYQMATVPSGSLAGGTKDVFYGDWIYTEKQHIVNKFNDVRTTLAYYCLSYYFENEAIPEDFNLGESSQMIAFTSEELKAYFYDKLNVLGVNPSLLYEDYKRHLNIDYTDKDLYNLKTYAETHNISKKSWLRRLFGDDDSYLEKDFMTEIKMIEVIENPLVYADMSDSLFEQLSNKLVMNACDLTEFSGFCKQAANENKAVVILRYAIADYRCTLIKDVWEASSYFGPVVGYSIEKSAMLNVSLAQIAFTNDRGTTVIPVVSNTVDSFGNGIIFDIVDDKGFDFKDIKPSKIKEDFSELFAKIKKIILIIFFVLIIVVVLVMAIKLLPSLIKTRTALRESRSQRRQAREEKKKQKNVRRH